MPTREERLAANEARFRAVNEDAQPRRESSGEGRYVCECADPGCVAWVEIPTQDYLRARTNTRWFVITPGHEKPDIETVVERHETWFVVEKPESVGHVVDRDI